MRTLSPAKGLACIFTQLFAVPAKCAHADTQLAHTLDVQAAAGGSANARRLPSAMEAQRAALMLFAPW